MWDSASIQDPLAAASMEEFTKKRTRILIPSFDRHFCRAGFICAAIEVLRAFGPPFSG